MPHADPVKAREYRREWKRKNRHRHAARDRAYSAARHANQRAEKYEAPGTITADEAQAILAAERCHWCGTTEPNPWWGLDHLVPLSEGGENRPENIRCCCHSCNASKYRGERPGKWARTADACRRCGTSERRHTGRGLCNRCYLASRNDGTLHTYPTCPASPSSRSAKRRPEKAA